MQTVEWTDGKLEERLERLDERFGAMERQRREDREWVNHRFDEVDRRIEESREMTVERFNEMNRRMGDAGKASDRRLGGVEDEVRGLRQAMQSLHESVHRANVALWVGSAGIVAAILAKGS
jgi:predicted  nucleic acid-binding Zn-ribbon protein